MAQIKYKIKSNSGEFIEGGYFDPRFDPATEELVVLNRHPDLRTEKWNGSAIVIKNQAELDEWDNEKDGEAFERILENDSLLEALIEELIVDRASLKTRFKAKAKAKK